ncbi:MAG: transposase family protein [Saprospiraceae bacterium]
MKINYLFSFSKNASFVKRIKNSITMRKLPLGINNERRLKSLTGLGIEKYELLLEIFRVVYDDYQAKNTPAKVRKRKAGGGRKSVLPTTEIKLLFVLYYLKAYPTFDLLGDRFGMASSTANIHLHKLMPLLQLSLEKLKVMPKRSFESPEELQTYLESLGGVSEILIDATEREHFRYQDSEKRNAMYSGKKKDIWQKIP